MSARPGTPDAAARPPWLIDRDLAAVAAHLDPWDSAQLPAAPRSRYGCDLNH